VVIALAACLIAAAFPLPGSAASHQPFAGSAKKCKKRKHHHKKRRCKRPAPAPAVISISPASQDFGVPQIGGESRTFTVTNVGGSTSGVPVPALTQAGNDFSVAANGCTGLLSAGASCPIDVRVGTEGAGPVSATLTVIAIPGGTASASMTANIEA
jgi:hypothetical protein